MKALIEIITKYWLLIAIVIGMLWLITRAMKIKRQQEEAATKSVKKENNRTDYKNASAAASRSTVTYTPPADPAKTQGKIDTLEKKLAKLEARYQSVEYAVNAFNDPESNLARLGETVKSIGEDNEYTTIVSVDLQSMSIPELQKRFRQNQRDIANLCKSYEGKYTTKANAMIYRLMVLALEAELQNILTELKFGKLETGVGRVRELTSKYYAIVEEGNQTIAPSIKRFISQLEFYYIEAVNIEYEYYVKQEQKKAEQKAIREQARQDAADRKANEAARKKLEAEAKKYDAEIKRLEEAIEETDENSDEYAALRDQLSKVVALKDEVDEKQEEIANLLNGKAGTIYVVSNIGAFGDDVFKVGMTRRLEPQERIDELSGASVPFPFDVHCMIFSEDAPTLETKMHHRLDALRMNKVNLRKEFFRVSLDEIERIVHEEDPTAEFHRLVPAEQYNQSQSL